MTRLFIRFYLGVLIVLFLAWYIHGAVLKRRADAEHARVMKEAHGGGARLVASELDSATLENRARILVNLREQFDYTVDVVSVVELPTSLQRYVPHGDDVGFFAEQGLVVTALSNGTEVVRLGPFPDYRLDQIKDSIRGWMKLTAHKVDASADDRQATLGQLQDRFDFPIDVAGLDELPDSERRQIADGADVVFYSPRDDRWFAATPLASGAEVVRFGPFPSFERIEQTAATTTLALVLLPAAVAIAFLLRPVAQQLRQVENAAKAIAGGDLSARVDEQRARSSKPLAQAFNHMANRTETLVRTHRELLQAVSHELRTPLSRMRFAIQLIETAENDEERKHRLDALDASAEELNDLVGELLRYVRAETAEPHLQREHVAVRDVIDALIPKYAALHPSIEFDCNDRGHGDETFIFADRVGLQRVLGNLLSNAGRFADRRVAISSESIDGATNVLVDDDGNGIPASERDRVLEPFVRLNGNANGQGVGLGLALVQRIVAQHGGHVAVLASPLGGCRVRTTWPVQPAAEAEKQ